jgi:hypothetical protein
MAAVSSGFWAAHLEAEQKNADFRENFRKKTRFSLKFCEKIFFGERNFVKFRENLHIFA